MDDEQRTMGTNEQKNESDHVKTTSPRVHCFINYAAYKSPSIPLTDNCKACAIFLVR